MAKMNRLSSNNNNNNSSFGQILNGCWNNSESETSTIIRSPSANPLSTKISYVVQNLEKLLEDTTENINQSAIQADNELQMFSGISQSKKINEDLENRLKELENENLQLEKDIVELKNEVQNRKRNPSMELQKVIKEQSLAEKENATVRRQNNKRAMAAEAIKECLNKLAIEIAYDDDTLKYFITFHGLDSETESEKVKRPFFLQFSQFGARDTKFFVERAEPSFKEFKELSSESNESQNLLYLLTRTRQYWIRDHRDRPS